MNEGPGLWNDEDFNDGADDMLQSISTKNNPTDSTNEKSIKVYVFFLLMFQTLFRLSDVVLRVLCFLLHS